MTTIRRPLAALSTDELRLLRGEISDELARRNEESLIDELREALAEMYPGHPVRAVLFRTSNYEDGDFFTHRDPTVVFADGTEETPDEIPGVEDTIHSLPRTAGGNVLVVRVATGQTSEEAAEASARKLVGAAPLAKG